MQVMQKIIEFIRRISKSGGCTINVLPPTDYGTANFPNFQSLNNFNSPHIGSTNISVSNSVDPSEPEPIPTGDSATSPNYDTLQIFPNSTTVTTNTTLPSHPDPNNNNSTASVNLLNSCDHPISSNQSELSFIHTNSIKVVALNINGGFFRKYRYINNYINKIDADIVIITESHLYKHEVERIHIASDRYKIYHNSVTKQRGKERENSKGIITLIKNILTPWISSVKNKGERATVISMNTTKWIKKDSGIEKLKIIAMYGTPREYEKERFWKEWRVYLQKRTNHEGIIIIGDLNVHPNEKWDNITSVNKEDKCKVTSFSKIMEESMVDTWRMKHPTKRDYTFFRTKKEELTQTRIDLALTSNNITQYVNSSEIEKEEIQIASDHRPISLTMEFPREEIQTQITDEKPIQWIDKVIDRKKINQEAIDKYKAKIIEDVKHDKEKDTNLEVDERNAKVIRIMMGAAKEHFGTREIHRNSTKTFVQNEEIEKLAKEARRLTRARAAIRKMEVGKSTPKRIAKLQFNSGRNKCIVPERIDMEEEIVRWKGEIRKKHNRIKLILEKREREEQKEQLEEALTSVRREPYKAIKSFFNRLNNKKRPQPQLRCITRWEEGEKVVEYGSEKVKEITYKYNRELFTTKKDRERNGQWTYPEYIRQNNAKVAKASEQSMKEITAEEYEEAKKRLAKNKAAGPDELYGDLIKITPEELDKEILLLFNQIMKERRIPDEWRESTTFSIHKGGDPTLVTQYRPIALLNTLYKMFISIINQRLSTIIEETDIVHPNQSGFRRNRSTHERILHLKAIIADSKKYKKPLHIAYIDISRAYDTVEHWAIEEALLEHGINVKMIELINNIYQDNTTKIITPYGNTEPIQITRGVRQGCPLSPLIFTLVINQLLWKMEEEGEGYLANDTIHKLGAFADDIVTYTKTKEGLQKNMDITNEYCRRYGMKLNIDKARTKTVTTNNIGIPDNITVRQEGDKEDTIIPHLNKEETYKYLGVWIDMKLDTMEQQRLLSTKLNWQIDNIINRCYSTRQMIEAINRAYIPAMEYRMATTFHENKWIEKIDREIARRIYRKMNINYQSCALHLQQPEERRGIGLISLKRVQYESYTRTIMEQGLNGRNQKLQGLLAKQIYTFNEYRPFREILTSREIELVNTREIEAEETPNYTEAILFEEDEEEENISIRMYIEEGKLITIDQIREHRPITEKQYKRLQEDLTEGDERIKQEILLELEEYRHKLTNHRKDITIWTDGSFKEGKATYGVFYETNHPYNCSAKLYRRQNQDNYTAELIAIRHSLRTTDLNTHLTIITDSESAIKAIGGNNEDKAGRHIIEEIIKIIETRKRRGRRTVMKHVYSHLLDEGEDTIENKAEKLQRMIDKYGGERAMEMMEGNKQADQLAEIAYRKRAMEGPFDEGLPNYVWKTSQGEYIIERFGREIKKRVEGGLVQLHKSKYKGIIANSNEENIHTGLTKSYYMSKKWGYHTGQELGFKIAFNKLKTKKLYQENERWRYMMERYSPNRCRKYLDNKCPMGCNNEETITHFLQCRETQREMKEIPRQILTIINKQIVKYNETMKEEKEKIEEITWFPSFYWPYGDGLPLPLDSQEKRVRREEHLKRYESWKKLDNTNSMITLTAAIPTTLVTAIEEIGLKGAKTTKIIREIFNTIQQTTASRWKKRCQELYKTETSEDQPNQPNQAEIR